MGDHYKRHMEYGGGLHHLCAEAQVVNTWHITWHQASCGVQYGHSVIGKRHVDLELQDHCGHGHGQRDAQSTRMLRKKGD